ncbi:Ankyrin repeat and EF-hand domain-containing protein 1, partial [Cichlidogyrus casuarinus]
MPKANSRLEILQIRKLLNSLLKEDVEQIKKMLFHGLPYLIDLGEPEKGVTPLIHCVQHDHLKTLKALLKLGARVNEADNDGATPIMHAAKLGNLKAFRILQDFNANTNILDNHCRTVLFYCASASESHAECLKLALESKVDVDIQDVSGCTALNAACQSAQFNEKICKLLLLANANPNIPSNAGRTPLMEACKSGSGKVVAMLARRGADLEAKDGFGRTAIFDAASGGFVDTLVALSAFGASFDVYDKKENSPMHLAAKGNPLSCRFLGQRGCNAKAKNADGDLPKTVATDEGFRECLKEVKKAEKLFGKVVKNAEPWALRLYDFMVTHNDELADRIKNAAQEEAVYRQRQTIEAELAAKALEEGQAGDTSTMMGSARNA